MDSPEKLLKTVIESQYFAVLNSYGGGLSYSNLISFAVAGDLKTLVFITGRNTRKYRNMQENNNISLLIDNRTNRPADVNKAVAITVIGAVREETDKKTSLRGLFLARHPQLEQFLDDPENALMCVTVREYIIAGFKDTQRVAIR
jgi:nitroimidazol reductase NimA-like FMN-containing flavoprotein (pyridoxamine 5'-phosphate oxidase superfamily)